MIPRHSSNGAGLPRGLCRGIIAGLCAAAFTVTGAAGLAPVPCAAADDTVSVQTDGSVALDVRDLPGANFRTAVKNASDKDGGGNLIAVAAANATKPDASRAGASENGIASATDAESPAGLTSPDLRDGLPSSVDAPQGTTPDHLGSESPSGPTEAVATVPVIRLRKDGGSFPCYLYTTSEDEARGKVSDGWVNDGVAWYAPVSSDAPMYRLHSSHTGEYFYTVSTEERDFMVTTLGWEDEGIGFYSDLTEGGTPVRRLYDPDTSSHFYTISDDDCDYLRSLGWKDEGIGWYAASDQSDATPMRSAPVAGVQVSPIYPLIDEGETVTLTATAKPSYTADDTSVVWASSDEKTATVDASGVVTGVAAGTATITATAHNGVSGSVVVQVTAATLSASDEVTMWRLYNPNSGEHFYTASADERDDLAAVGWSNEGVGWIAPGKSGTPVWRLYNELAGDHHYTTSAVERDDLKAAGWQYEGVGWYSAAGDAFPNAVALWRLYNPFAVAGSHHYTLSAKERADLGSAGWCDEGVAWYAVRPND